MTLDLFSSFQAKHKGIERVACRPGNKAWLEQARNFVRMYVEMNGEITSDVVHERCAPPKDAHPNIMGSLFATMKDLQLVGYMPSRRVSGHARRIGIYKRRVA